MSNQNIGETIERDKWDRPLITPPDGGKPVGYTRASTLAKALDTRSTFNAGNSAKSYSVRSHARTLLNCRQVSARTTRNS